MLMLLFRTVAKLSCLLGLAVLITGCDSPVNTIFGIPTVTPPLPTPYPTIQTSQAISANNANRVTLLAQREGHPGGVWDVAFSPDGQTLAALAHDAPIRLWSVRDGVLQRTISTSVSRDDFAFLSSVAFSPDGQTLIAGGRQAYSQFWRVADGQLLHSISGPDNVLYSVAFSPDGKTVAASGPVDEVGLVNASDGKQISTLPGHSSGAWSVAFSPDGQTLASGGMDGEVRLWEVSQNRLIRSLSTDAGYVRSVVFSPDGQTMASAGACQRRARFGSSHFLVNSTGWQAVRLEHSLP